MFICDCELYYDFLFIYGKAYNISQGKQTVIGGEREQGMKLAGTRTSKNKKNAGSLYLGAVSFVPFIQELESRTDFPRCRMATSKWLPQLEFSPAVTWQFSFIHGKRWRLDAFLYEGGTSLGCRMVPLSSGLTWLWPIKLWTCLSFGQRQQRLRRSRGRRRPTGVPAFGGFSCN